MADMSAEAVTSRLRQASELASLCVKLSRAIPDPAQQLPALPTQGPAAVRESSPDYGGDK